jgi:hypothetical protein
VEYDVAPFHPRALEPRRTLIEKPFALHRDGRRTPTRQQLPFAGHASRKFPDLKKVMSRSRGCVRLSPL